MRRTALDVLYHLGEQNMKISRDQMYAVLYNVSSAMPITVLAITEPKVKKDSPFLHLTKEAKYNGFICSDYEKSVNRELAKIGEPQTFEVGPNWHEPIMRNDRFTPFCRNKKNHSLYLRMSRFKAIIDPIYRDIDGREYSKEEVKPYLYAKKPQIVQFLCLSWENVKEITMNGQVYEIGD
jgi:hypothetical protein